MNRSALLVIFGTGAHARKVFHCWRFGGGDVWTFADDAPHAASPVPGIPVIAGSDLERHPPGNLFIGVGRAEARQRLMDRYQACGWQFPAIVHPRAYVAPDAVLEPGVLVAAGAVVESGSHLGRGVIVDVGVVIDHDCRIEAFSHLPPGHVSLPGTRWP